MVYKQLFLAKEIDFIYKIREVISVKLDIK